MLDVQQQEVCQPRGFKRRSCNTRAAGVNDGVDSLRMARLQELGNRIRLL